MENTDEEKFLRETAVEYAIHKKRGSDPIPVLVARLQIATTWEEKHYVLSLLAVEYQLSGDLGKAEKCLLQCLELNRSVAASWIALAKLYAFRIRDADKAIFHINQPYLRNCYTEGLRQYVLLERIVIAIQLQRIEMIVESLSELVEMSPFDWSTSFGSYDDIVPGLKKLQIDPTLIQKFVGFKSRTTI